MAGKRLSRYGKAGLPPGTLVHVGKRRVETPSLQLFSYDPAGLEEKKLAPAGRLPLAGIEGKVIWLNVDGIHDTELLSRVGESYGVHSLVLEDILNTAQRPKMEEAGSYVFFVFKMIALDPETGELSVEQVSFLLGKGLLITFQERPGDLFDPVRERLRKGLGRLRKAGADYLAYALLDVVVDRYFVVLEQIQGRVEELEDRLAEKVQAEDLREIHFLRRQVRELRQLIWPLREALFRFRGLESELINEGTGIYLSDLYDHLIQVLDMLENCREGSMGLIDLHLSMVSNRMNEVMKILTVIATLFIPLTFLAGIYGMNFDYMPELQWKWSYPLFWGLMVAILSGMAWWFRRIKWL